MLSKQEALKTALLLNLKQQHAQQTLDQIERGLANQLMIRDEEFINQENKQEEPQPTLSDEKWIRIHDWLTTVINKSMINPFMDSQLEAFSAGYRKEMNEIRIQYRTPAIRPSDQ
jgi:hypothetical protein